MGASLVTTLLHAESTILIQDPDTSSNQFDIVFCSTAAQPPPQNAAVPEGILPPDASAPPLTFDQSMNDPQSPDWLGGQTQWTLPSLSPDRQVRPIDGVTDPTAWLMSFRFRESWNWPVQNSNRDRQEFQFRPTIPFRAWDQVNILRVTVPYNVQGPGAPGLKDVTVLDLVVFEEEWGRLGVGPVVRMTPQDGRDTGNFQLGPAIGAVSEDQHWTVGVLMQNFFADNVGETRIQPILAYKLDDQWAIGVGEFEFRYDWENGEWIQVPLGIQVDYITDLWGQKTQFFINPQYNFESDATNSGWTIFLGMSFLVPGA